MSVLARSDKLPALPAPSDPAAVAQRIALLDAHARDAQVGGVMTICLVAFVGLLLRDAAPGASFAWWLGAVLLAALFRASISAWWRRRRAGGLESEAAAPGRWEALYAASALCSGLAWASLALVTSDIEQVALPITLILTLALVLASTSSAGNRLAQLLFALPVVLAQEANLIRLASLDRGNHDDLVALVWVALIAVLFFIKRGSSSTLRESLAARAEHERRALRQTALIDNAPLGIVVFRDRRIAVVNDALLRLLGYARKEDLIGRSVRVLLPDDAAWQETIDYARDAIRGPIAPRIVRRKRADGSLVDVLFKVAAVPGTGAEPEFIGIYEDVQERLAAEEHYRASLRMHRLVFESAGEGIAVVNDGSIERGNQALADLLGVSTAQLEGRPLRSIFEDAEGWAEIEGHFQRFPSTLKLERRIVRSDGRPRWVSVTGRRVDTDDRSGGGAGCSIWVLADLSLQKQKEAENWHHANHDMMTGLPNRRFLQDRLDQAIASARRDGRRVAVVELDLDGFKSVNDVHGHRFGDAVLEEVARRLSTVVRELDTVGRWGGDEFVLVLREIDSREIVEETVKRVIARLSESILFQGKHLSVGASIGIALYPDDGEDVESLMLAADLAMYESKAGGGNTWRFAAPVDKTPRGKYRPAPGA